MTVTAGAPDPGRRTAPLKPKRTRRAQSCDKLEPDRRQPPDPTGARGAVRGWSPCPPIHLTQRPCTGQLALLAGETGFPGFSQQEPASREQTDSRYGTLPSPPLDMCLTRTPTPTHPHTPKPLCQPLSPGCRMRHGEPEVGEQPGEREALLALQISPGRADLSLHPQGLFLHLYRIKKQNHCLPASLLSSSFSAPIPHQMLPFPQSPTVGKSRDHPPRDGARALREEAGKTRAAGWEGTRKPPGRGMSFAGSGLKAGCRRGQGGRKQHHCVLGFAEVQWDWGGPGVPGGDWEQYAMCVCTCVLMYRQAH